MSREFRSICHFAMFCFIIRLSPLFSTRKGSARRRSRAAFSDNLPRLPVSEPTPFHSIISHSISRFQHKIQTPYKNPIRITRVIIVKQDGHRNKHAKKPTKVILLAINVITFLSWSCFHCSHCGGALHYFFSKKTCKETRETLNKLGRKNTVVLE
jgi:hypothetical protein